MARRAAPRPAADARGPRSLDFPLPGGRLIQASAQCRQDVHHRPCYTCAGPRPWRRGCSAGR
ncbi:hypothetical protein ACPA9J_28045 [Pseudomonas aeruginosa]